jgi:hypothetical protein
VPQESFFYDPEVRILGFHPYKEVIFLSKAVEKKRPLGGSMEKGLASHLSTSSVETWEIYAQQIILILRITLNRASNILLSTHHVGLESSLETVSSGTHLKRENTIVIYMSNLVHCWHVRFLSSSINI